MTAKRSRFPTALMALMTAILCSPAMAQELSPRAYWPAPVGTDVAIVSWQRNDGDILIDPSLPITGVESEITYVQVAYQRFLDLWGRTASLQVNLPYADGTTEGVINGEFRRRETSGLTDARVRLTINLKGAPAMDPAGFRDLRANPQTIIGASVIVQAPTGDYDEDRVINLGTNRWSIKPAIGMIVPLRPTWLFEAEAGAWFFEDNDDFLGATREQKPVFSLELHLVKRVAPGFWATLDANYYRGGETRAGNGEWQNLQRNSRAGFTVVFPIQGRHAFRGSFSTGVATRSGGEYDIYSLSYVYAW